jgi:hypothetical protein
MVEAMLLRSRRSPGRDGTSGARLLNGLVPTDCPVVQPAIDNDC